MLKSYTGYCNLELKLCAIIIARSHPQNDKSLSLSLSRSCSILKIKFKDFQGIFLQVLKDFKQQSPFISRC